MDEQEITKDNIKSYLKTRKGTKYFFKFPWFGLHPMLIVDSSRFLPYSEEHDKQEMLDETYKAYKRRMKRLETLN